MIPRLLALALILTSLPALAQPLPTLAAAARGAGASEGDAAGLSAAFARLAQETELHAGDAAPGANFGYSVAMTENRAVVGAPFDATLGTNAGAAYVFVRSGDTWAQEAKLLAPDGAAQDRFGWSVAISDDYTGDRIVVGAPLAETAYVFQRPQGVWSRRASLNADDRAVNDYFGYAVATSFGRVVVGAPNRDVTETDSGAAYLFTRQDAALIYRQRTRFIGTERSAGDRFGTSVAILGEVAAIGAPGDDDPLLDSGAAYLFTGIQDNSNAFLSVTRLRTPTLSAGDALGTAVAVQGGTTSESGRVAASAPGRDRSAADVGAVFVFEAAGRAVTSVAEFASADSRTGDVFGSSLAMQGDLIAVGTDRALAAAETGIAYLFALSADGWRQTAAVEATDAAPGDRFGRVVALSSTGRLIVGASRASDAGERSGSAYIFAGLQPVGTEAPVAAGAALSLPAPNPASARAVLTLHLDAPQAVRAVLVDALGREAAVLLDGVVAGDVRLDVPAGALAPGVYTVRVSGATVALSRRLTIVR